MATTTIDPFTCVCGFSMGESDALGPPPRIGDAGVCFQCARILIVEARDTGNVGFRPATGQEIESFPEPLRHEIARAAHGIVLSKRFDHTPPPVRH